MAQWNVRLPWMRILACLTFIKVASLYKTSVVIGSHAAFFSGSCWSVPLAGAAGGIAGGVLAFLMRLLSSWFVLGALSLSSLAFFIPGLCSSLYWATRSSLVRFWLPAACMVAFAVHPVGREAFPYALYWLIPMGLYLFKSSSLFATALGSTFVAHAVGSVIWLYTVPMAAATWLALIPMVAVERTVAAAGMALVCYAYYGVVAGVKMAKAYAYRDSVACKTTF